ncbi:2-keto-3-deoxygluconate permease [Peribacillus sp. JNUCC 23]
MEKFLPKGSDMLIPFFAFALGMGIDLEKINEGGLSGMLLGVLTVVLTGGAGYLTFKFLKWNLIVGATEGSTAGNEVATPAASVVTTAISFPIFV